jgi:hypothetical protein
MADADAAREEHRQNHLFLAALGAYLDERFFSPISFQAVGDFDPAERVTAGKRAGFRQAVNDMLEMTQDFTAKQMADADQFVKARGALTLTEMRARRKNLVAQVLKRRKIRNETEYYMLEALVSDVSSSMNAQVRAEIGVLLRAFELGR